MWEKKILVVEREGVQTAWATSDNTAMDEIRPNGARPDLPNAFSTSNIALVVQN